MADDTQNPDSRGTGSLLDRLDSLPTPSPVAMRLLGLLDDEKSTTDEIVELISSDPALVARVIGTCARHPLSRAFRIDSIERAVVMLGFDSVRVAALSVRFFETLSGFASASEDDGPDFDMELFWRHSLTVAVMAERISSVTGKGDPSTAFIAGLLHDIGHLGLCAIAPRIFQSACDIAEAECGAVDDVAARHLGIGGRSAGRRIGSRWKLPPDLVEAIWLVDQPVEVMAGSSASDLVMVVSLADAIVSRDHVCITGHGTRSSSIRDLSERLELSLDGIQEARASVFEEVDARAEAIGLDSLPTTEVLLRSVSRANAVLGRFALAYRNQSAKIERCESDIESLVEFHRAGPFVSLSEVVDAIGDSACGRSIGLTACIITPTVDDAGTLDIRLRSLGETRFVEPSSGMSADVTRDVLARHCLERCGRVVDLELRDGGRALVALGRVVGSDQIDFDPGTPLRAAWSSAIDDALVRERSNRLVEHLAEANREIMVHRETMAEARASSAIGAIAAGAAHEMNNPLAIIMGRSHLLGRCLSSTELSGAAGEIQEAASRLAGLVSSLAESVAPIEIKREPTDVAALLSEASGSFDINGAGGVSIRCSGRIPIVRVDARHVRWVIRELLDNALRASVGQSVTLDARELDGTMRIRVSDSGPGFTEKALEHALQPFFSDQSAGRRPGLGLAKARRLVEAHGGTITVQNGQRGGGLVSVVLPIIENSALPNELFGQGTRRVA
ncbi:MAG: HDOD domain-containing protein [Phycisphaerales bacterium]|nr:HDOD domain-containing protein [Phycisphaerales bacterium]